MEKHSSHPDILKRLKRVEGHLRGVIDMIENQRPCVDIAQQLQAVESAVAKAKKALIHDHIDHCLDGISSPPSKADRNAMDDFKQISKYL
jgi:DNA-binding FrmR family transcriptional regulator